MSTSRTPSLLHPQPLIHLWKATLVGTMAPNQSNRLLYENEDVQLIPTFEKKGERFSSVHQNLTLPSWDYISPPPFTLAFRIPHDSNLVCQWRASFGKVGSSGSSESDSSFLSSRCHAVDGLQAWLRRRRMRRVYRHDFQKGQGDQYHQVSSRVYLYI